MAFGSDGRDNLRKALANSGLSETAKILFGRAGVPAPFDAGISPNANAKGAGG